MTKLTWGAAGERIFETGVDRGVLYVAGQSGVPWNGIKAIREIVTGGEPKGDYIDGVKYSNYSGTEDFAASIEAFSSPPEFAACDGRSKIAPGLYATQQKRKNFHLAYRTKVGDDISGADAGYKLHLIYNALASTPARDNNTVNASPDTLSLVWDITTKPHIGNGFIPTAHFVIDINDLGRYQRETIENMLYGTETEEPYMPPISTIVALFNEPPLDLYITNVDQYKYTAEGRGVTLLPGNVFAINDPSVTDNGDNTFTIIY